MVGEALSAFAVAPREYDDDLDEAERAEFEHEMCFALQGVCDLGRHRL